MVKRVYVKDVLLLLNAKRSVTIVWHDDDDDRDVIYTFADAVIRDGKLCVSSAYYDLGVKKIKYDANGYIIEVFPIGN